MIPRIFSEGLDLALQKGLQPFYLLTGQDPLLVGESKDKIAHAARQHGFDEKIDATINHETKWDLLFEQVQSHGLFSLCQIVVLNCPETLTASQQKSLAELLGFSHSELIFILHLPKFSKANEKQAWFSQIGRGLMVNCQTPTLDKMPLWLQQRANAMGLQLDPEAVKQLCYSYEGNLLALKQSLQLLQLQFPDGKISLGRAREIIDQAAQFTPFQWIDALLEGKIARATRILQHLQQEEIQPVVLLRLVQKELMLLLEISRANGVKPHQTLYNGNLRTEFDRLKIWQNRRAVYQAAVKRLSYRQLYQLIQQLAWLEKQVKQQFSDTIWLELERFGLGFVR